MYMHGIRRHKRHSLTPARSRIQLKQQPTKDTPYAMVCKLPMLR
jgi:hypothetical protein